jgi:hypothetical protein
VEDLLGSLPVLLLPGSPLQASVALLVVLLVSHLLLVAAASLQGDDETFPGRVRFLERRN